ncbi:hypothetical protein WME79_23280 [Sorangium sp. So ce726]|uniref:hypothetical protein n=1 Tax=Sorangium sp. So ce726 TaxID=3133319 RepID=UPI003F5E9516
MTILFYESRSSSEQNQALKEELARLSKQASYRSMMRVAAIADVSEYNYWPVKGIVKDKVREQSAARGMPIYCDWDGSFRKKLELRQDASNVILIGRDGRVRVAFAGTGKAADRALLIDRLRAEVE